MCVFEKDMIERESLRKTNNNKEEAMVLCYVKKPTQHAFNFVKAIKFNKKIIQI